MQKVQGIGGVFFKAQDPKALSGWYRDNLGLDVEEWGGASIKWSDQEGSGDAYTVWNAFHAGTDYFEPSTQPFMVNFRVNDLDAMLAQLRENGCDVQDKVEEMEFGKFGWVMDPEGNKVELWQPPAG